ncbi:hypothetical protein DXG01_011575 [Tephrocybe rancida]|nr:hypothetical protein DXG01_011575 [Tephrocybe rancida]
MRTTIGVYYHLGAYLDEADEAYAASLASSDIPSTECSSASTSALLQLPSSPPPHPQAPSRPPSALKPSKHQFPASPHRPSRHANSRTSVNPHLCSAVYLGTGMCNIILNLVPGKLAMFIELFRCKGDRRAGFTQLMRVGGWYSPGASGGHGGGRCEAHDM